MTHPALWWTLMTLRMIALRYFINQAKLVSTLHSLASVQRRDLTASEMSAGKWMLILLDGASVAQRLNSQGHPTSIFGKYLFGRRFEIWNFRNICRQISCLPASPRICEHLKNGIIAHFNGFLP